MKRRVLILYHRTPFEESNENGELTIKEVSSPNGILNLLKTFVLNNKSTIWIAGSNYLLLEQETKSVNFVNSNITFLLKRVVISKSELKDFYHITSKEGFWPVLHSFPEKFNYLLVNWENFVNINKRFAEAAIEDADDNSIIWIHDYNLWIAPFFIRERMPKAKIAFFLHTSFPSADIFNILPWRKQIVKSLLCCDLLNFAIPRYVENFITVVESNFHVEIKRREAVDKRFSNFNNALNQPYLTKEIEFKGKKITLNAFPVGPDSKLIKKTLIRHEVQNRIKQIRYTSKDCRIIFAASRLDYIKGTDRLLECYLRLLDRQCGLLGKVKLEVVAVRPANGILAHNELAARVKDLVEEIKLKYMTNNWNPIDYTEDTLSFQEMIVRYAAADIMWVPSLRDGTNLVCKEYLAVKGSGPGVLLLSEFVGASIELPEAVTFNPYSPQSMDDSLDKALSMPFEEQILNNTAMSNRIYSSSPELWAEQLTLLS